jgi:hypothetical protein
VNYIATSTSHSFLLVRQIKCSRLFQIIENCGVRLSLVASPQPSGTSLLGQMGEVHTMS